jgi:sporulation protein YlmC with PRC-barrel domain
MLSPGPEGASLKTSELKGKAVVSMADGVQVGRVDDVLFDTTATSELPHWC